MTKTKEQAQEEISAKEAAEILGVSLPTVARLSKRGLFKRYKRLYGKQRTFYLRTEIESLRDRAVYEDKGDS